jgi:exoribonuclease-2
LYKNRPARVERVGDKLEILIPGGETIKVRPKDVVLLHPGPLLSLGQLQPQTGDLVTAWELLAGQVTTLAEVAELAYGDFNPASAWAAWQLLEDGLYFRGEPDRVTVVSPLEVAEKQATRAAEQAEKQAWAAFLERVRTRQILPEDERYLTQVEALALGRTSRSRVMHALGREETPENAHALLLELGVWDETANPYPLRLGAPVHAPPQVLPDLPPEPRRDLTHLLALAIDDATTETPDDALSLEGDVLWVHVADPAAVITPDSEIDLEARARGATLHLPENTIPMLPRAATPRLGLGLSDVSPALSFGLHLDTDGRLLDFEIVPSWVRVTRLTYEAAAATITQPPLDRLYAIARQYQDLRRADGAVLLDLPEVAVRVEQGQVVLTPVLSLPSRLLVENAMIMTGEAVARYALVRDIPVPYATQEVGELGAAPRTLASMYAQRRLMRRSQHRSVPGPHGALGLSAYTQATSPLRRYLDLVVHQQLRAFLRHERLLSTQEIVERVGAVEAVIGSVRAAEQNSNQHWTLVYLKQHPDWRGQGVLVEKRGLSGTLLVPELGMETTVHLAHDLPLDSEVALHVSRLDLPNLRASFRVG